MVKYCIYIYISGILFSAIAFNLTRSHRFILNNNNWKRSVKDSTNQICTFPKITLFGLSLSDILRNTGDTFRLEFILSR